MQPSSSKISKFLSFVFANCVTLINVKAVIRWDKEKELFVENSVILYVYLVGGTELESVTSTMST